MVTVRLAPQPLAYGTMFGLDAAAVILAEDAGGSGEARYEFLHSRCVKSRAYNLQRFQLDPATRPLVREDGVDPNYPVSAVHHAISAAKNMQSDARKVHMRSFLFGMPVDVV